MKIGRNAPCPCGSGKKYKRCCLDKDQRVERQRHKFATQVSLDAMAARLGEVADTTPDFSARVTAPATELREELLDEIGSGLIERPAAEALAAYLLEVEGAMKDIA